MIPVVVRSVVPIAEGVRLLELVPAGEPLPGFGAGDHVDLELAPGMIRSYSLVGTPEAAPRSYRLAVALTRDSRGGSRLLHSLYEGTPIALRPPVSGFPLVEDAAHTVLIAGGIGITPVMSMVRRLVQLNASWELHYAARTRRAAAFLPQLEALDPKRERVRVYLSDESGPRAMALGPIIDALPATGHLYCCGPPSLLAEFGTATAGIEPGRVHSERFQADAPPVLANQGLTVELASSGAAIEVGDGESILDALLDAGVDVEFSCMEGICGSCRTKVLDGKPEHRDSVLTAAERASGDVIIVCVSGAKGNHLVLDL
jgi:vanillate O-demethylase ferredoxin subunit